MPTPFGPTITLIYWLNDTLRSEIALKFFITKWLINIQFLWLFALHTKLPRKNATCKYKSIVFTIKFRRGVHIDFFKTVKIQVTSNCA